ncbi:MAG: hypothetical protein DHS20C01_36270 [marine bacterium B5-7]|nr:MAG: hypothetical protein DHS20C01_36270 [marine bacterium B5-7]
MVILLTTAAQAQTPRDLDDLLDVRASSGESELQERGYYHIKTLKLKRSSVAYWWSPDEQLCIAVSTRDGRYASILKQPEVICDDESSGNEPEYNDNELKDEIQDLVGMRTRSGERELEDLGFQFINSQSGSGRKWSNWWNRSERKCITVVTMRERIDSVTDTLPPDCERHGSSGSGGTQNGYGSSADYSDLVGLRASSAERELEDRGFRNVDSFKSGSTAYTIWYKRRGHHCLQMAIADGRADSIVDIHRHDECR